MSAFIVSRAHIDALVRTAISGPSDAEGQWHGPSWSRECEPREIIAGSPQYGTTSVQWIKLATAGMAELVSNDGEISADELGRILWTENVASVRYRYPNDAPGEEPGTYTQDGTPEWHHGYTYNRDGRPLTAVEAFKAISCLDYQSCEHPEWRESEASRILESLKDALISVLPGYSAASWEISTTHA
jgi:hypothetical protein